LFIIYAVRVVVGESRAGPICIYIYEHVARGTLHRYAFNSRGLSAIFVVVRPPQPLVLPLSDPYARIYCGVTRGPRCRYKDPTLCILYIVCSMRSRTKETRNGSGGEPLFLPLQRHGAAVYICMCYIYAPRLSYIYIIILFCIRYICYVYIYLYMCDSHLYNIVVGRLDIVYSMLHFICND